MYYLRDQRIHHIHVGYFFTVAILLVALHLLEGAGPPEADRYTIFILLAREVRRRARLAALRGGEHCLLAAARLAARWPWVGGAAAGVARLCCSWAGGVKRLPLRFGAKHNSFPV